jgi:hypothetical protein
MQKRLQVAVCSDHGDGRVEIWFEVVQHAFSEIKDFSCSCA